MPRKHPATRSCNGPVVQAGLPGQPGRLSPFPRQPLVTPGYTVTRVQREACVGVCVCTCNSRHRRAGVGLNIRVHSLRVGLTTPRLACAAPLSPPRHPVGGLALRASLCASRTAYVAHSSAHAPGWAASNFRVVKNGQGGDVSSGSHTDTPFWLLRLGSGVHLRK